MCKMMGHAANTDTKYYAYPFTSAVGNTNKFASSPLLTASVLIVL